MIAIIDYGRGNLFSLKNAMDFIGADTVITADKDIIAAADKLILPGVGAFPDAMNKLNALNLSEFIREQAKIKPLLGICLGMQLLFDEGNEFCRCKGLSLVKGSVVAIDGKGMKIPHMGWNELIIDKECPLLDGVGNGESVYFVHSFRAETDKQSLIAHCQYSEDIPALVSADNVFGAQFHPEKSGKTGIKILSNFVNL